MSLLILQFGLFYLLFREGDVLKDCLWRQLASCSLAKRSHFERVIILITFFILSTKSFSVSFTAHLKVFNVVAVLIESSRF